MAGPRSDLPAMLRRALQAGVLSHVTLPSLGAKRSRAAALAGNNSVTFGGLALRLYTGELSFV
jgi:hypothetical protein